MAQDSPALVAERVQYPGAATRRSRAITLVALFSGLAMLFGYGRDVAIAGLFGASTDTDAFFIASLIPVMLGRVIWLGTLTPAIVPVFSPITGQPERFRSAINSVVTIFVVWFALASLALVLGSRLVVSWIAPGFTPSQAALTADLLVIMAPAVGLLGLMVLFGALLNTLEVYGLPALASALANGVAFVVVPVGMWTLWGVRGVAAGMVAGSLIACALLVAALYRRGWRFQPIFGWRQPEVVRVLKLSLPLLAFMVMDQCVTVTERIIASNFGPGELSQLTLANKLFQLPSLLASAAVAAVIFVQLAQLAAPGKLDQYLTTLWSGILQLLFLATPLALWFFFASPAIVRLVFQHGEFSAGQVATTAGLLQGYSLAILPTGLLLLFTRAFQARQQTLTPLFILVATAFSYLGLAVTFSNLWGIAGLPLAFALNQAGAAVLSGLVLLTRLDRLKVSGLNLAAWLGKNRALVGLVVVNLALGLGLLGWQQLVEPWLSGQTLPIQAALLGIALGLSGCGYLLVAARLGISEAGTYLTLVPLRRHRTLSHSNDAE